MKNKARLCFVSRAEADAVLEACPDAEWRLIFALSRYSGLRCPTEHLALTWSDVDWERGRLRVPSSKTEHHAGGECRTIPLFEEVRVPLLEVFEAAEVGTEFVVTRYRQRNSNLRTQLQRIIHRAGVNPWPKLFHNLRSTRQTELAEQFPIHVVCQWLGNSQAVAQDHYLQVTESDFETAINPPAIGADGALERVAQNAAQQPAETPRNPQQTPEIKTTHPPVLPGDAMHCGSVQGEPVNDCCGRAVDYLLLGTIRWRMPVSRFSVLF